MLVVAVALFAGCDLPPPTLATMVKPVVTAQRLKGGALQAILTWDTSKTACGTLSGFRASLDEQPINASAGAYTPDAKEESLKCQFPGFLLSPASKNTPRTLVLSDDSSTFTITVDTLEVGTASAFSKPPTLRPGDTVRWQPVLPVQNTSSWSAGFTATDGTALTWQSGTTLSDDLEVTVPAVRDPLNGAAELRWVINSTVSRCEGPTTCDVKVEGFASFPVVINP